MPFLCIASSLPQSFPYIFHSTIHSSIPPCLHREEECEDGVEEEEEEEEKEEETPVTESDSDEQEGADTVSNQTTPRYFRTWW